MTIDIRVMILIIIQLNSFIIKVDYVHANSSLNYSYQPFRLDLLRNTYPREAHERSESKSLVAL